MSNNYEIPLAGAPREAVWDMGVDARASFIAKTYAHLFGAIIAFTLIELAIFTGGYAEPITTWMYSLPGGWLPILGVFMLVSWGATHFAQRPGAPAMQYLGLALMVLAYAFLFVPMLYIADTQFDGVISSAAVVTLVGFAALTGIVFWTRKDFSFLGGILRWAGICAFLLIIAGALFSFSLGPMFSVAMIAFAGAAILWDTSKVLHHYPPGAHVSAATQLFASVALLFWYVLRLFMSRD